MLLETVDGARVTQSFGPPASDVASLEPAMWATADRAYWLIFPGAGFYAHFHPGIDRAAAYGSPIRAMEAGTVRFAAFKDNISGYQVEVEIRPGTSFSVNHLSRIMVRVGAKVQKGSTIGLVGTSGASTGPHTHEGVTIKDEFGRSILYDPDLFTKGGRLAGSHLITPLQQSVQVNGAGVNIRKADADLFDRASVYAVSKDDGIYRLGTGNRIGPLDKAFPFLHWRESTEGEFAIVTGFGRRLAIHRSLVHFT